MKTGLDPNIDSTHAQNLSLFLSVLKITESFEQELFFIQ